MRRPASLTWFAVATNNIAFGTTAELRPKKVIVRFLEAVTESWIKENDTKLEEICQPKKEPVMKMHGLFLACSPAKRKRVLMDPLPFLSFDTAVAHRNRHVAVLFATLHRQLTGMFEDEREQFGDNPGEKELLLFIAMLAFYHPKLVVEFRNENRVALLAVVPITMLAGMRKQR